MLSTPNDLLFGWSLARRRSSKATSPKPPDQRPESDARAPDAARFRVGRANWLHGPPKRHRDRERVTVPPVVRRQRCDITTLSSREPWFLTMAKVQIRD